MKTIIVVAMIAFLGVGTAYGASKYLKSVKIAEIGVGSNIIDVRKIEDGDVTCYITRAGNFGAHAISCVK